LGSISRDLRILFDALGGGPIPAFMNPKSVLKLPVFVQIVKSQKSLALGHMVETKNLFFHIFTVLWKRMWAALFFV